jgi:3-(methylthio)propanoyl-CoA dehydrogenase
LLAAFCRAGRWRALIAAAKQRADDPLFYAARIATAHFFADHILPQAVALEASIVSAKGDERVLALAEDQF